MRGRPSDRQHDITRPLKLKPGELDDRLDHYYKLVKQVLLSRQDPISGLMPASTAVNAHGNYTDAWVRDNVYSIMAVWGLGIAYRKLDWDRGRTYELEQSVVKMMRGLLFAMMRQADKVERFKKTNHPLDALHAKYDTRTAGTVVGDGEWGHLQLDATSLWLLMLAQMTASGIFILFTIDEVNFVQNLVYYIGRAYRTPDYGIWERGNKMNHGYPELNSSSIGMAKAALEALSGLDLFGVHGSQASVLHVLADEIARCRITLESLLPWESSSKEVDSALLSVVGFPAFAIGDAELATRTRTRVVEQLQGNYGFKRFLRDGHQTVIEDVRRLHYEPWELKQFDHIESEWPLFYTYMMLDGLFRGDEAAIKEYRERLESITVDVDGVPMIPELYVVPAELVEAERAHPKSQKRVANANVPLVWAQSLYYLALMLDEGLLDPAEVDPLGRRLRVGASHEPVVQVALMAEDESLQVELEAQGVATQTPRQIAPIQVRTAGELSAAYNHIGRNDKLGLTGRPIRRLRSLTTSKIFHIRGQQMVFLPSFLDHQKFYLTLDKHYLVAQMRSELAYIQRHWRNLGRPVVTLLLTRTMLETGQDALLDLIHELRQGQCGAAHVRLGRISELRQTSAMERIDFLHDFEFSHEPVKDARLDRYRLMAEPSLSRPLTRFEALEIEQEFNTGALLAKLQGSVNLYLQVEVLERLMRMHSIDFVFIQERTDEMVSILDLLEDVYAQAARGSNGRPFWTIVRRVAGLCDKNDVAVSDAVTDIIVRQKQMTVGKSYSDASVIDRPLAPEEIRKKIREYGGSDVRGWVLTQEMLIYLGLLIKSDPKLLSGLMTLRVGYLILLITSDLAFEHNVRQEEAHELLMDLSPSEIQKRLADVLGEYEDRAKLVHRQESLPLQNGVVEAVDSHRTIHKPKEGWLHFRQREGTLSRVPNGFYSSVWNLLKHCKGLIIGDKLDIRNRIESHLVLSEMTAGEKNFALWIEHLLNKMDAAKYRQINVETLIELAAMARRSPSLFIDDYLVLDVIIGHAVRLAWLNHNPERSCQYEEDKPHAWTSFYETSPPECSSYVVKALQLLTSGEVTD